MTLKSILKEKLAGHLAVLLVFLFVETLSAQTTVSTPIVGFVKSPIKGTSSTGGSSHFSFVPVQLNKTPVFSGTGTASGTTVALTGASLTNSSLNSGSFPTHYLRVQTGTGTGVISDIVSNTTNSVVTSDDLSAYLSSGALVSVIPHVLLTDLLGQDGSLVVYGGTGDVADLVYLVGSDGTFKSYYYKTGLGAGWKDAQTGLSVTGLVVYPSESVLVERKQASTAQAMVLTGQVAPNTMKVDFLPGFNSVCNAFPRSLSLSDLTGSVTGGDGSSADLIYFIDSATGQLRASYYKTGLGAGWKDAPSGLVADTTTDISYGFIVQRRQANASSLSQNAP